MASVYLSNEAFADCRTDFCVTMCGMKTFSEWAAEIPDVRSGARWLRQLCEEAWDTASVSAQQQAHETFLEIDTQRVRDISRLTEERDAALYRVEAAEKRNDELLAAAEHMRSTAGDDSCAGYLLRMREAEKRAEEIEQENRQLRSEAAYAELRGLAAEMRKVREVVESSDSYVPQDVAAACLLALKPLDQIGKLNTLIALVDRAMERIADLQSRELTEEGADRVLHDVLSDATYGSLRAELLRAILSARGSR